MPGVSVSLIEVNPAAFINPTTTDAVGKYVFTDVPVGAYSLSVPAADYVTTPSVPVTVEKDTPMQPPPITVEKAIESRYLPAIAQY